MDTLRGTICLWLSLMCAGVQCWPNVRLSSRQEEAEDESVNVTEEKVQEYLQYVTWQARNDLESYFLVKGINIKYWKRGVEKEPNLKTALSFDKSDLSAYPDRAISALLAYFEGKNNPDINVLLTDIKLYKGRDIRKGYGYSEDKTLCQSVVPMLLAYAPNTPYSSGRMLAEMTRTSVNPHNVPYVHNRLGDFREKMKNYLRNCGKDPEHPGDENAVTPPQEKPTDNPDHTETPPPPDTATPPAEPPTPAPPAPKPPAPKPPAPKPPAPEPSEETPSEPGEKPTSPPEPTTTTGVPDYC
uniref:Putative vegetative cell wall protein gp1 n=1 Tax=Ixodes ricinus TaxID=34613 RepID=A0A6B0V8A4_IXORI